jgi:hypothetical protein
MTINLTQSDLNQFTGCMQPFFDGMFKNCFYTDGVKFLREHCGWVVTDILAHLAYNPKVKGQDFVTIKVNVEQGFISYIGDGPNGDEVEIERQDYNYMDFPFNLTLFAGSTEVGDKEGVMLMLPSEY